MVDAASWWGGGALVNKNTVEARDLFNLMAQNTQQFGAKESQIKRVNEIGFSSSIES